MKNIERINKILAIIYAIGLGTGEAVINWGNWQYAPLWIIDYIIVIWLLYGALIKNTEYSSSILVGAWAFALATMFMAAGITTAPEFESVTEYSIVKLSLIFLLITTSIIGLTLSYKLMIYKKESK